MDEVSPFGVQIDERVAVFIDGPNLYAASKLAEVEIDFKALLEHFEESCRFLRPYYFTAVATDEADYSPLKPLIDFLAYNGFTVATKPMREFTDDQGRRRNKGSMDVDIACSMMELVFNKGVDHIVLFSGNGDFRPLIETVQRHGVRVTVVSLKGNGDMAFASDDIRRQCDRFVDLPSVISVVGRPKQDRSAVARR